MEERPIRATSSRAGSDRPPQGSARPPPPRSYKDSLAARFPPPSRTTSPDGVKKHGGRATAEPGADRRKGSPASSVESSGNGAKKQNFANRSDASPASTALHESPPAPNEFLNSLPASPKIEPPAALPKLNSATGSGPEDSPTTADSDAFVTSEAKLVSTWKSPPSARSQTTASQDPSPSPENSESPVTSSSEAASNSMSNLAPSIPQVHNSLSSGPESNSKPVSSTSWASLFASKIQQHPVRADHSNPALKNLNDVLDNSDLSGSQKSDDGPSTSQPSTTFSPRVSFSNGSLEGRIFMNGKPTARSSPAFDPSFIDAWNHALLRLETDGNRVHPQFIPRGLINTGNCCFMNSVLQALLSCPPFLHFIYSVKNLPFPRKHFPTLNAFLLLLSEFDIASNSGVHNRNSRAKLRVSSAFIPYMFSDVISSFRPSNPLSINKQEDAQEFLSFLLDSVHEELLLLKDYKAHGASEALKNPISVVPNTHEIQEAEVNRSSIATALEGENAPQNEDENDESKHVINVNPTSDVSEEDEEWMTVGHKNKASVLRSHEFLESELSKIFGGKMSSVIRSNGNKSSTTIQPFLLLHLDILSSTVSSVEDALKNFSASESLSGYKPKNARSESISARKSVKIEHLPRILILHLMRFSFQTSQGVGKIHKPIRFGTTLTLGKELLSSKLHKTNYELIATVTHHGKESNGGHYTADTLHHGNHQWLRFDDGHVSVIPVEKVLQSQAYLLFYQQTPL